MRLNTSTTSLQFSLKQIPIKSRYSKGWKKGGKTLTCTKVNCGALNSSVHSFCAFTLYGEAHKLEQYICIRVEEQKQKYNLEWPNCKLVIIWKYEQVFGLSKSNSRTLAPFLFGLWRRDNYNHLQLFVLFHTSHAQNLAAICWHKCEVTTPNLTRGILEPTIPPPTFCGCVSAPWTRRFPPPIFTPCWVTAVFGSFLTGSRGMVEWQ